MYRYVYRGMNDKLLYLSCCSALRLAHNDAHEYDEYGKLLVVGIVSQILFDVYSCPAMIDLSISIRYHTIRETYIII